jgi:hypothetical protein
MPMKRRGLRWIGCIGALVVVVWVCAVVIQAIEERELKLRIEDVRWLLRAYREHPEATTVEELIESLRRKGIELNTPLPAVSGQPCYRLIVTNEEYPGAVLIEEQNVRDPRRVVLGLSDGSVVVRRKGE